MKPKGSPDPEADDDAIEVKLSGLVRKVAT